MPDEPKPWNGIPENPERDGWHWTKGYHDKPEPTEYRIHAKGDGLWWWRGSWISPERAAAMAERGWRYLGPCLTPSEMAAQLAAARREAFEEAASLIECGCKNRHEVVMERPNSAARWNLCEHPNCMMIEAAAIRALAGKETSDV